MIMVNNKMKGLLKGLRYISQIFEEEEEEEMEMQIGYPIDVKHVAHIGSDGPSTNAPSWMGGFQMVSTNESLNIIDGNGFKESTKAVSSRTQSPEKRRHRRSASTSDSPTGTESVGSDKESNRGSTRHSRSHQSAGSSAAIMDSSAPSNGGCRRGRRHSKASNSNTAAELPSPDVPAVPKQSRRRKPKDEVSSSAVALSIPPAPLI